MRRELAPVADTAWWSPAASEQRLCRSALVARARGLIDAAPTERWTLGRLSAACDTSRSHLCHIFSEQVGIAPVAYALQRRVAAARYWLGTRQPISWVAHELGFADQSHLTRLFLRVLGITPGEYRSGLHAA